MFNILDDVLEKADICSRSSKMEPHEFQEETGREVIVALDAVGLYPSISKEVATTFCREAVLDSEIEAKNMNYMEATRFLDLSLNEEQVEEIS